jgi:hypothetical protein
MNSIRLAIYLLSAINVGLFIFVALLAIRGWKKSIGNKYYFFVILFSFLWLVSVNIDALDTSSSRFNYYLSVADLITAIFVAYSFAQFSWQFPKKIVQMKIVTLLKYVAVGVSLVLPFVTEFFPKGSEFLAYNERNYAIYISGVAFLVGIGGYGIIKNFRDTTGIKKKQLGYVSFGFLLPMGFLVALSAYSSLIRPISADGYVLYTNVGLMFSLLTVRAIFQYRFLDIRVFLQRSLVRISSFLALLLVYLLLILVLRDTLISETKQLNPISAIVVGLLIILTVEPLRKYIYNFVDKRFELYDRQKDRIQKQLQIVLKSQRSLSDLEQAIRKAFQETACVDTVDYVDADDQKLIGKPALRAYLQSTGKIVICEELPYRLDEDVRFKQVNDEVKGGTATAYVPIGQNEIFVGCFVLGQRKGKTAYSAQEVSAMKLLQSQATDAFLNARLYKQAVERIRV